MSNSHLQEVFQKFSFRKKKDRGSKNRGNSHSDEDDDDNKEAQAQQQQQQPQHRNQAAYQQQPSSSSSSSRARRQQQHQSTQSQPSLSVAQREYLQKQREYLESLQQAEREQAQQKQRAPHSSRSSHHSSHSATSMQSMAFQQQQQQQQLQQQQQQQQAAANMLHHKNNGTTSHHKTSSNAQHSSSSARKSGRLPTGTYSHLDPKLFHSTMSQQQVAKTMGLTTIPMYRTDEKGYIEYEPGLLIRQNFVVMDTLGRGTFSKVFEAHDMSDQTKCAIKVIRNTHRYIEAAKTELRVLQHITNADDGTSACIHLKEHFSWNNHPCFVFKLYGPSIYTVMSRNRFRPFPDSIVRSLTYQICNAIQFMHHLGIIFTDLKPENMVFVDGRTQHVKLHGKTHAIPLDSRIKIVDFGSAVYEPRYDPNSPKTWKFKDGYNYLIQTRHYRAPEVVLEMAWKRPVDVWSVGCVVLEFLYGSMVFNTHCPIDHLNQMQKMIGAIPRDLIRCASDAKYKQLFHHPDGTLRLEDARRSRAQAKRLDAYFNLHKLEHRHLYDLVSRCLKWRANERIYGHHLLKHEYFHFIKNMLTHHHKFALHPSSASASAVPATSTSSSSSTSNQQQHQPQQIQQQQAAQSNQIPQAQYASNANSNNNNNSNNYPQQK